MSGECAAAVYPLPDGGFVVWCLEHGGELSRWETVAIADTAADRHRKLLAA